MKFETLAIHAGQAVDAATLSRAVPIHRTAAYMFKDTEHAANLFALKEAGNIYTRLGNPTQDILEQRMAQMEGGAAALALASGTSAVFYTIINICDHGDEVLSTNNLYGGTYTQFTSILPQLGIKARLVNQDDDKAFENAINERTRVIYGETLGNPSLNMLDMEKLSRLARKYNLPLIVDSTFTPPSIFRPIDHGADIVIHSLTKWIGGHGTSIGGIVVDSGSFDWRDPKFTLYNTPDASYHGLRYAHDLGDLNPVAFALRMRLVPLRNLGACISPDNCWAILQGIETLSLRMEKHCSNAAAVAKWLAENRHVAWVHYPGLDGSPGSNIAGKYLRNGFGAMVVFGLKGGFKSAKKFINAMRLISHLANVGDAKSLAIHPASTTHSQLSPEQLNNTGIREDMIRLSVGIEHLDDIIEDMEQALAKAEKL